MFSDCSPLSILSATLNVGVLTEGWNLADLPDDPLEPDCYRQFRVSVGFDFPFSAPPVVHAGLTGFDVDNASSARLSVAIATITAEGFEVVISSWRDTRVYSTEISWLAIGP
jgi:hypothetical protein